MPFYPPMCRVGVMEVQIPLEVGLWDTLVGRPWEGHRGVPRFVSGFWALPGHRGVLEVDTLLCLLAEVCYRKANDCKKSGK